MARMQIKHIINPNAIHTDDAWALSEDEYILDLKPEDLPTDAV